MLMTRKALVNDENDYDLLSAVKIYYKKNKTLH